MHINYSNSPADGSIVSEEEALFPNLYIKALHRPAAAFKITLGVC